MGQQAVKSIQTSREKINFLSFLINDILALDRMIKEDRFEKNKQRIGAEQELCLVDDHYDPARTGPEILPRIEDKHLTTELAKFNLEINLDPFEIRPDCLRQTEKQLHELLNKTQSVASDFGSSILLCGILPTIRFGHLQEEWMTPMVRYKGLSDMIKSIRGKDFEIHIQGVDELIASLDSVLFEACNTSFQLHLQIHPSDYVRLYNWAQLIAGPILSVSTNSPLLLGRELWQETRIALFQQSVDSRSSSNHLRDKEPRVGFGSDWIWESVSELFKDHLTRFPLILTTDISENALDQLDEGIIPKLGALGIHNGTIYTWNRPCYGITNGLPHLRIENRYLPGGPSTADEMANFAFWLGLMKGMPEEYRYFYLSTSFRVAKDNFFRAARTGMNTVFNWFGQPVEAGKLVLDTLLPIARVGLKKMQVNQTDADRYLDIIENRVIKRKSGAQWQVRNFRKLKENFNVSLALNELTKGMLERQQTGDPVHLWPAIDAKRYHPVISKEDCVSKVMQTDLFTVTEDEPMILARAIMKWKKIRHLPVENLKGDLTGLITATNLKAFEDLPESWENIPVKKVMVKKLITVNGATTISSAKNMMDIYSVGCLPIVEHNKMVGLVTDTDLKVY